MYTCCKSSNIINVEWMKIQQQPEVVSSNPGKYKSGGVNAQSAEGVVDRLECSWLK